MRNDTLKFSLCPSFNQTFMSSAWSSASPPCWNARWVVYTSRRSGNRLAWAAGAIASSELILGARSRTQRALLINVNQELHLWHQPTDEVNLQAFNDTHNVQGNERHSTQIPYSSLQNTWRPPISCLFKIWRQHFTAPHLTVNKCTFCMCIAFFRSVLF
jgi:hypothetical protein